MVAFSGASMTAVPTLHGAGGRFASVAGPSPVLFA